MARRWREEGSEATPGSRPAVSQIADTKKHPSGCLLLFEVLVAGAGFEPTTFGVSVAYVDKKKMKHWLGGFSGALNDTGDLPVYKRGDGHCG
jgi:toxic protein SymE